MLRMKPRTLTDATIEDNILFCSAGLAGTEVVVADRLLTLVHT